MTDQYKNKYLWIYLTGFFVILALPLLNLSPWFFPSDWGKTIIFRIVLSILILLFIYQILFRKEKSNIVQRNVRHSPAAPAFWLLVVLLGVYFLATIFSSNPYFSFWGSPYRSGGSLNFSFYIIFAILAFLVLRKQDWQKIWPFAILIGVLVSIVAVFQQLGIFSKVIIPYSGRPPSTIGGPTVLAIYLLLLGFLTFVFLLKEKQIKKKVFYFLTLLLFIFVILLSGSRAVYFGLLVGSFYFIFLYSVNLVRAKRKTLFLLVKILLGILLMIGAYGVYYINTHPKLPDYLQENEIFQGFLDRLSIDLVLKDARPSAWTISFEAVKQKPILGYGPENFSIGFDKYYDPTLPDLPRIWWDRAHNFIFDIPIAAGIPALIIYLSLFAALFWGLQKIKKKRPEQALFCHGIQAAFLAYLAANFFSFDVFSTYLIFFLLVTYSLYLISSDAAEQFSAVEHKVRRFNDKIIKWRKPIFTFLLVILIWFIWSFNLKPLQINKEINLARYLSEHKDCDQALLRMENILSSHSILDNYLKLTYIDVIASCIIEKPEKKLELTKKAIKTLKETAELRPYYTRSWLLLGSYTNTLIAMDPNLKPGDLQKLKDEANYYLERAYQLSPNREEILISWAKTDLLTKEYQKAKEKIQKCINLDPESKECWWLMGLANLNLGEKDLAEENIDEARKKGYDINSENSLLNLAEIYARQTDCQELIELYKKLIIMQDKAQYHASLATCYKEIKDFKKAREEALKVLELEPEAKAEVELFLQSLPY